MAHKHHHSPDRGNEHTIWACTNLFSRQCGNSKGGIVVSYAENKPDITYGPGTPGTCKEELLMVDRVGQQIGNYRLSRLLGRGGFAEVYLGEHIHLKTLAAVKMLWTQLAKNEAEKFR